MTRHLLLLDFPPTTVEGVFLIKDISQYAPGLPIACPELQILPPGYSIPTVIGNLHPPFDLVLNACSVGIIGPLSCQSSCPNLPDGIWHIRYDVSPNSLVYVEYDVMRITHAMNMLMQLLCKLNLQPCLPDADVQKALSQLEFIRLMLLSSKVMIEDEHKAQDGMNQYRYAISLINKLSYTRSFC